MTQKEIDEIRASLDSTAPYYVHALLAERDRLTERWKALKAWHQRKLESLDVLEYRSIGKLLAHSDTLVQMADLEAQR